MLSSGDTEERRPTPVSNWPLQYWSADEKPLEETGEQTPDMCRSYECQWAGGQWAPATYALVAALNALGPWKPRRIGDFEYELGVLRRSYTIADSDYAMGGLLQEEPGLFQVLRDAVVPLEKAFGEKGLLYLRVQEGDDDRLLKLAVHLPVGFGEEQAARALDMFDDDWWLKNCHRAGALVIDYEIEDGI
jgi:hypothetical protein